MQRFTAAMFRHNALEQIYAFELENQTAHPYLMKDVILKKKGAETAPLRQTSYC